MRMGLGPARMIAQASRVGARRARASYGMRRYLPLETGDSSWRGCWRIQKSKCRHPTGDGRGVASLFRKIVLSKFNTDLLTFEKTTARGSAAREYE
ncbi:MAG: hypothetical protein AB7P97_16640 [Hyphomonadaceae bacterium]